MNESIEMQTDAFSCRTLNDLVVLEAGEQAFQIATDLEVRETFFTLLSRIEQSPSIKGMACVNTTAYPGDERYRSFMDTVMGEGGQSLHASGVLVSRFGNSISQIVLRVAQFPKPVVAGMSGTLTGDGLGVVLACDFRFATPDVMFTFPNIALGFPPAGPWSSTCCISSVPPRPRGFFTPQSHFRSARRWSWALSARSFLRTNWKPSV